MTEDNGEISSEQVETLEDTIDILSKNDELILDNKERIEGVFRRLDPLLAHEDLERKVTRVFTPYVEDETAELIKSALILSIYNIQSGIISEYRESEVSEKLLSFIIEIANKYGEKHLAFLQKSSVGENAWRNAEIDFRFNDDSQMIFDYTFTKHNGESVKVSNTFSTNMTLLTYVLGRQQESFNYINETTYNELEIDDLDLLENSLENLQSVIQNVKDDIQSNQG